jgi:hypothetical protein
VSAQQVAVPQPERVELGAIGGIESAEIPVQLLGVEQPRLQLAERGEERVGEAAEPGRTSEPVEGRARKRAPDDERPLRLADDRPRIPGERELSEDVVEGPDRAGEKSARPA